jgi:hypothetical protein
MKVYIVFEGAAYEGESAEGVFSSLTEARTKALQMVEKLNLMGNKYIEKAENYWESGLMFIRIEDFKVQRE